MGSSLDGLTSKCRYMLEDAMAIMRAQDVKFAITDTFRSTKKQYAYYCQGRKPLAETNARRMEAGLYPIVEYKNSKGKLVSGNDYIITNCDGTIKKSFHQSGNAVDIVPVDKKGNPYWPVLSDPAWLPIVTIMEACGFEAGYRWEGELKDAPHYQVK